LFLIFVNRVGGLKALALIQHILMSLQNGSGIMDALQASKFFNYAGLAYRTSASQGV